VDLDDGKPYLTWNDGGTVKTGSLARWSDWAASSEYTTGDIVTKDGITWRANTDHTSSANWTLDYGNWDLVSHGMRAMV
jgi:hypothetical protein